MPLTLDQLASTIAAHPDVAREAIRLGAKAVQVIAVSGIKEGFETSADPDGVPWKPLAFPRPRGGTMPLLDRGLLRASVSAQVTEDELILRANSPGARVHQFGATITPKKPGGVLAFKVGKSHAPPKGKGSTRRNTLWMFARSVTIPARKYLGVSVATGQKIAGVIGGKFVDLVIGRQGLS